LKVKLSLEFDSPALAAAALLLLSDKDVARVIAPADRPDAGAGPAAPATPSLAMMQPLPLPPAEPKPPEPNLAAVFGQQNAAAAAPAAAPGPPPVAAPVPPPVNPSAPTLDSSGLPWDSRIHADTKGTIKDGTWRTRKNVDPAFKTQVEAELRAALSGTVAPPVAAPVAPPAATQPTAATVPTAAPVAPPPPPATSDAPAALDPNTFAGFAAATAPCFQQDAGKATRVMVAALQSVGLSAMGQLSARPDLISSVKMQFDMGWALP
jgi:hypothetical protein